MSESDDDWLPIPEELVEKTTEKEEQTAIVKKLIFEVVEEAMAFQRLSDEPQAPEQIAADQVGIAEVEHEAGA